MYTLIDLRRPWPTQVVSHYTTLEQAIAKARELKLDWWMYEVHHDGKYLKPGVDI